jgi:hypothetical protein
MDAGTQGPDTLLSRIAYQANVLLKDLEPDLESILVKPDGFGVFAPEAMIQSGVGQRCCLAITPLHSDGV